MGLAGLSNRFPFHSFKAKNHTFDRPFGFAKNRTPGTFTNLHDDFLCPSLLVPISRMASLSFSSFSGIRFYNILRFLKASHFDARHLSITYLRSFLPNISNTTLLLIRCYHFFELTSFKISMEICWCHNALETGILRFKFLDAGVPKDSFLHTCSSSCKMFVRDTVFPADLRHFLAFLLALEHPDNLRLRKS